MKGGERRRRYPLTDIIHPVRRTYSVPVLLYPLYQHQHQHPARSDLLAVLFLAVEEYYALLVDFRCFHHNDTDDNDDEDNIKEADGREMTNHELPGAIFHRSLVAIEKTLSVGDSSGTQNPAGLYSDTSHHSRGCTLGTP
jgi:hypothetical protein